MLDSLKWGQGRFTARRIRSPLRRRAPCTRCWGGEWNPRCRDRSAGTGWQGSMGSSPADGTDAAVPEPCGGSVARPCTLLQIEIVT